MNKNTVTTGEVRFSHCHLFKPDAAPGSTKPNYSVTALIPKTDMATIAAYKAAEQDALAYGIREKWGGVQPPVLQGGLKDGDGVKSDGTPYGPECKGCYVLTCKTGEEYPPEIVDQNLQPVIDPRKVYSGCYGRVNFTLIPYNNQSKGIKAILNCVQVLRDGTPLGGTAVTAAEAFGAPAPQAAPMVPQAAPVYQVPPAAPAASAYPQAAPTIYPQAPAGYGTATPQAPQTAPAAPAYPQAAPTGYAAPTIDPITGLRVVPGAPILGI